MDLSLLRERYIDLIPFVASEVTDGKLKAAFREAANFYSKFSPIVKKVRITVQGEHEFTTQIPDSILRVYYDSYLFSSTVDSLCIDWDYQKPILSIYAGTYWIVAAYNRSLGNTSEADLDEHDLLDNLVKSELILALSNKRRTAALNDLPFDFKGDTFAGEARDDIQRLRQQISETIAEIHY